MSDLLPVLYHWSPRERRTFILREGLQVYSEPVTHTGDTAYPYLCFGPTPSIAWALSGDIYEHEDDGDYWDLWMYRIRDEDSVYVRPSFGATIEEVKIRNSIPPGCLWYVATRHSAGVDPIPAKPKRRKRK